MADIEEVFAQASLDMFNELGEDALFTPLAGDPVDCKVILEQGVDLQPGGYSSQAYAQGTTIEYILASVGKEADRGETFEVGEDTWTVQAVEENDGTFCKVTVK